MLRMRDIICEPVVLDEDASLKKGEEKKIDDYKNERDDQYYPLLRQNYVKANRMNLSFAGGGFLGIYHVGVTMALKKHVPHLVNKISGASAGAIAACCLLCGASLVDTMNGVLHIARETRKHALGAFCPFFSVQNVLLKAVDKLLPDDVHIRVNGKLHISLTRVYDGKNVIVSQFNSKEDVLQALGAASFVPVFSGILAPRYHGMRYMDGGFSDNLPTFGEDTITVVPFCGESDICPKDSSLQLCHFNAYNMSIEISKENMHRVIQAFLPPEEEILLKICNQGRDDAWKFLHRRNLL